VQIRQLKNLTKKRVQGITILRGLKGGGAASAMCRGNSGGLFGRSLNDWEREGQAGNTWKKNLPTL